MPLIVVTADDFGLSEEINEAVERAHREGILTAASLMVSAPATDDAIARARRLPGLRVGLHVALVQGTPVLAPSDVPALVGRDGRFPDNLTLAGLRWFLLPEARRQLRREVAAQFSLFRSTGLTLDHVNAHNHMHLHPTVLSAILAELEEQPRAAVRLPREPWSASFGVDLTARLHVLVERAVMAPWLELMKRRLRAAGVLSNDWLLGLAATGNMNEATLLKAIDSLPEGMVEIYCHPATRHTHSNAGHAPDQDNEGEFAALVSGTVRARIVQRKLRLGGFTDVYEQG